MVKSVLIKYPLKRKNIFTCGSIINGHRSELVNIVAFSVDILSLGRPSLFQIAI